MVDNVKFLQSLFSLCDIHKQVVSLENILYSRIFLQVGQICSL